MNTQHAKPILDEESATLLEGTVVNLLNDVIVLVEHTQRRSSSIPGAVIRRENAPMHMPQYNMNRPQHGNPQQQPYQPPYPQFQQFQQQPHFNQIENAPIDLVALLERAMSHIEILTVVIEDSLQVAPSPAYKSEFEKLAERIAAIEEIFDSSGDDEPVEAEPEADVVEETVSFPTLTNFILPVSFTIELANSSPRQKPNVHLENFMRDTAEKSTRCDIESIMLTPEAHESLFHSIAHGVYDHGNTGQIYVIHDFDNQVCITVLSPLTGIVNAMFTVMQSVGQWYFTKVKQPLLILTSLTNDTFAAAIAEPNRKYMLSERAYSADETKSNEFYPNILNIDGLRESIVTMRKHISTITVPKVALKPILEIIGNMDWRNPETVLTIDAEDYNLITATNAVYSLKDNIRLVVVRDKERVVLMAYDSRSYLVHDLYNITYNVGDGVYEATRTESLPEDTLFVISLGTGR